VKNGGAVTPPLPPHVYMVYRKNFTFFELSKEADKKVVFIHNEVNKIITT
jgi:hypothetical protein